MSVFFTSDTHYYHRNIIEYCKRPFVRPDGQPAVEQMHRTLITNWNEVVGPRDTVYHLGDFAFGSVPQIRDIRSKLNGFIFLIRGNHDRNEQQMLQAGFNEVHGRLEIDHDEYRLYLAHVPLLNEDSGRKYKPEFKQKPPQYYDYWLCGHVHEKWKRRGKVINVGVDQWSFTPRTLQELLTAEDGT